jgi:hypothetical protein
VFWLDSSPGRNDSGDVFSHEAIHGLQKMVTSGSYNLLFQECETSGSCSQRLLSLSGTHSHACVHGLSPDVI